MPTMTKRSIPLPKPNMLARGILISGLNANNNSKIQTTIHNTNDAGVDFFERSLLYAKAIVMIAAISNTIWYKCSDPIIKNTSKS